jgi:DNA-binding transcriptional ArsR family regulator
VTRKRVSQPDRRPDGAPRDYGLRKLTDPRAMRALAHPMRLALLEALVHAGTLTATQASEALGESPANCAFHLRTLAKYGFVEEAGGGQGRERPWRRTHTGLNISSDQDDPGAALAAEELAQFWLNTQLERARNAMSMRASWPAEWKHNGLGESQYMVYVTPDEMREFADDISALFHRYFDRVDHPERRPADSLPIEVAVFSYPLLHLAARPWPDATVPGQPAAGESPSE